MRLWPRHHFLCVRHRSPLRACARSRWQPSIPRGCALRLVSVDERGVMRPLTGRYRRRVRPGGDTVPITFACYDPAPAQGWCQAGTGQESIADMVSVHSEPSAPGSATPSGRTSRRNGHPPPFPYINRELSWLEFNARVLYEARDQRNPALERARFLAIFASNLDEFFQVRVAGLRQQHRLGSSKTSPDGLTAAQQLEAARKRVLQLVAEHSVAWAELRTTLAASDIAILEYASVPQHHARLRERFVEEIFPVLTPLAVAPGHPFPYISTMSLSLAVGLLDPETGERRFARVKVPQLLSRLLEVEPGK